MSFYTRKEIAALTGRTEKDIGQMSYRGKVPGRTVAISSHKRTKYCYDKKIIDHWIESLPQKGDRSDGYVKKHKAITQSTITFKDIFAGKFLPHEVKMENFSRLAMAQIRRPKTTTVRLKAGF